MTIFELAADLAIAEATIGKLEREIERLRRELAGETVEHRERRARRDPDAVDAVTCYFGEVWINLDTGKRFVRKAGLRWEELMPDALA